VDGREAVLNWVLPSEYTPVTFLEFSATPRDDGILLAFRIDPDLRVVSAYLERQSDSGTWSRIGPEDIPVAGDGRASLLDTAVLPGERYRYRVALLMPDGSLHRSAEFESEPFGIPAETVSRLLAPFPNPAEHEVWIPFRVTGGSAAQRVTIRVLDAAGRLVRDLYTSGVAGSTSGSIVWDGRDDRGRQVPAGFYLAVLETSTGKAVRKIVIRR
jgi:hypothetical protein